MAALAALESVSFAYGERQALVDLTLAIAPGEVLGLVGPNGAGKTTALRLLTGLAQPARGVARIGGVELAATRPETRRGFGYVPDGAPLYSNLTPLEHLHLVGRLHQMPSEPMRLEAVRLLDELELGDRAREPVGSLSRGMRQKAAIACALLPAPPLLILDEPLTGLDAPTTLVIKAVLRGWADRGGAVLYTSHLLDVVERLADRIAVLRAGRLVATGTLAELRARSGQEGTLEQVFRSLTQAPDPQVLAERILGSLSPRGASKGT